MARLTLSTKNMPRINIKDLGLTPEQAKNTFGGLPPEQIGKKVQELQAVNAQNQSQVSTFTDKVNQIKGIKKDEYADIAVGANPLARGFGSPITSLKNLLTGGKQNFIADVQNLTNKETLDNLIAIKAAGGTFGSLTERELDMLINSATKIGSWEMKDEKGKVKGYDIGQNAFNEELSRLQSLAEKAVVKAGGNVNSGVTSSGIKYSIE